ncbi:hypothetical protein ZOSMA_6G01390 [Zostera marina]|uniref:Uncharacterized protein n=1 Tax=Zostera marina TaxID=29655 RepID=A0A0K9NT41_ZOSMR|nr:hypothetical protein ZOSMA_6G01390 [Zostera marina]
MFFSAKYSDNKRENKIIIRVTTAHIRREQPRINQAERWVYPRRIPQLSSSLHTRD